MGRRDSIRLALRTGDLARLLGVSRRTVFHWLKTGRLVLTGDPIEDFDTLAAMRSERS